MNLRHANSTRHRRLALKATLWACALALIGMQVVRAEHPSDLWSPYPSVALRIAEAEPAGEELPAPEAQEQGSASSDVRPSEPWLPATAPAAMFAPPTDPGVIDQVTGPPPAWCGQPAACDGCQPYSGSSCAHP